MKRLLILVLSLGLIQLAYAVDAANIKLNIAGPIKDNRYFLCIPDLGCLSIFEAKQGKVYQLIRAVDMNDIFVMDSNTFKVYPQGLPNSCNVNVQPNQTIIISGKLTSQANNIHLNALHCKVA